MELMVELLRGILVAAGRGDLSAAVESYRAGYLAQERRSIEERLKTGGLRAIVATNALELGIDIGCLDCTVILGYPGSQSSLMQQSGRSGRGSTSGATFLILTPMPLCAALARDPQGFLARPTEAAVIPCSSTITRMHILAGAGELPYNTDEFMGVGGGNPWVAVAKGMIEDASLIPAARSKKGGGAGSLGGSNFVSPGFVPNVAKNGHSERFGLRSDFSWREYELVDGACRGDSNRGVVEVMEERRVRLECLPPPLFGSFRGGYQCLVTSRSASYYVEGVDNVNRVVQLTKVPSDSRATYFTRPVSYCLVDVTGQFARGGSGGGVLGPDVERVVSGERGLVTLTTGVLGFTVHENRPGHMFLERVDLSEPVLYTDKGVPAVWFNVSPSTLLALVDLRVHPHLAIHAAAHAILEVVPTVLLCDPLDLDTEHISGETPGDRPARVLLFERKASGLARAAWAHSRRILTAALGLLVGCECVDGCTQCLRGRPGCGYRVLGRVGAITVLRALLA